MKSKLVNGMTKMDVTQLKTYMVIVTTENQWLRNGHMGLASFTNFSGTLDHIWNEACATRASVAVTWNSRVAVATLVMLKVISIWNFSHLYASFVKKLITIRATNNETVLINFSVHLKKVKSVTLGHFEEEKATSSYILDCHALPPSSDLASELQCPVHTNLDTSSTFFIIGLWEDASVHPKYQTHCRAAGLSTPGFLRNMVLEDGS